MVCLYPGAKRQRKREMKENRKNEHKNTKNKEMFLFKTFFSLMKGFAKKENYTLLFL